MNVIVLADSLDPALVSCIESNIPDANVIIIEPEYFETVDSHVGEYCEQDAEPVVLGVHDSSELAIELVNRYCNSAPRLFLIDPPVNNMDVVEPGIPVTIFSTVDVSISDYNKLSSDCGHRADVIRILGDKEAYITDEISLAVNRCV